MYMAEEYIYLLTGDTLKDFDESMNDIVDPFVTHTNRLGRLISGTGNEMQEIGMGFVSMMAEATSHPETLEVCERLAESMDKQLAYYEEFQEVCEILLDDIVSVHQNVVDLFEKTVCQERQGLPVGKAGT